MQKLIVDLEFCYGIKRLYAEFDFSESPAYAIYAPNGMMKSSLAETFKDIANDVETRDRVFPERVTRRTVVDESGAPLEPEAVLVLPPYDEVFGDSEKTAMLLVDNNLRKEYEQLYLEVDRAKARFLKSMKEQTKSRKDLETEISRTFTKSETEFYQALIRVRDEVDKLPDPQFADVPYDLISDEKIASFLASHDIKAMLQAYIAKYNELLAQSKYFRKGTFDYYNAATIAKTLAANGFFDAKHTVTLNGDQRVEVTTEQQLTEVIAEEKASILRDEELRKTFDAMEKRITKNEMLRDFQEFLSDHEEVLALMGNLDKLREDVWKSYFKAHEAAYHEVIDKYQVASVRGKQIEAAAARQQTHWENVIEIFNRRFFVPFQLVAKNKVSVVLGDELAPTLGFTFCEGTETAQIDHSDLLQVLSTGEKKALYILNVIFEVEVRRAAQMETVFVVDDIADSFDYKNKYAIIQYLKDIADESCFKMLILTHNFDFYRTINSRGIASYKTCLMVQRTSEGLALVQAAGIKNVFVNDWKQHFFSDGKKRLAAIAFVRNIVEYTRGEDNTEYRTLTALLHWKGDTNTITHAQLDGIYSTVFSENGSWPDPDGKVVDTVADEASACLEAPEGTNFENKIVLAIAIRLIAEKHMIAAIADPEFVAGISTNQTFKLIKKYKELTQADPHVVAVLDQVALMTPDNIHLNSFMYEPIVDMSDDHLRVLYQDVLNLSSSVPVASRQGRTSKA